MARNDGENYGEMLLYKFPNRPDLRSGGGGYQSRLRDIADADVVISRHERHSGQLAGDSGGEYIGLCRTAVLARAEPNARAENGYPGA